MGLAASTIAAIANPPGPARRGILRVSGPRAAELVRQTLQEASPAFDPRAARGLHRGLFDDGRGTQPARALWLRGPRSYTREDVVEFHLCGAEPLLACALRRLLDLGAEPAPPGEFTRRAFLNGRLDLSQAEAVLALVEAASEEERRSAALLLDGGLERRTRELREQLLDLRALCEASLDFDEAETGHVPAAELRSGLALAQGALEEALSWEVRRASRQALPRVVLVGAPSAGKSSLWNALTSGNALTSELAGTTRDPLEGLWDLGAFACLLVDGPGADPHACGPGAAAQALFARERASADLALWVVDASRAREPVLEEARGQSGSVRVGVWNKIDLPHAPSEPWSELRGEGLRWVSVSAARRSGLRELERAVREELQGEAELAPCGAGIARLLLARHRSTLEEALRRVEEAGLLLAGAAPLDLTAEELRAAVDSLDVLTGRATQEDVLDRIFARFCLGK